MESSRDLRIAADGGRMGAMSVEAPAPDLGSIVELLRWRAATAPERAAYLFSRDGSPEGCEPLAYGALCEQAGGIAAAVRCLVAPGARVLLLYPPGLDYIRAFYGCLLAGAVAVPAYLPRLGRGLGRVRAIAADCGAELVLTTAGLAARLRPLLPDLRWLASDRDAAPEAGGEATPAPTTVAFLQYTSGSTGSPRGVEVTHANLLANLEAIRRRLGHTQDTVGVAWLPPYHDMGLIGAILQPLYAGFPVVLMAPLAFAQRPASWLELISHFCATASGAPNFGYELCLRRVTAEQRDRLDLSCWQVAFTGAEPICPDTLERFAAFFAPAGFRRESFCACYGLAEATLMVTGSRPGEPPRVATLDATALAAGKAQGASGPATRTRRLVSCGPPVAGHRVAVLDPQTQRPRAQGEVGEIWVAGPSVARGYWGNAAATAATFAGGAGDAAFLRTGDLGFVHGGELYVTGRLKEVIIIRGRNHFPPDIERTVEAAHPLLRRDAGAAFGVEVGGEERLVVAQEVERRFRDTDRSEVIGAIREAVAREHELQVSSVVLLKPASTLRTSSGKVRRLAVREAFLENRLELAGGAA